MTADPHPISAVIPTRGDVDLTEILATLAGFDEVVIWNNGLEDDLAVYGRYAGVRQARNPIVYTQDDDCLIAPEALDALARLYQPGRIVANMPVGRWPDYPDSCLVGWGAVFDRDLPERAFERLRRDELGWPWGIAFTEHFYRTCDVAFSTLTPHTKVDFGFRHLPWAEDPARAMFKQPGHKAERDRMLEFARQVRDA